MGPKTAKTIARDAAKAMEAAKTIVKLNGEQGAAWDIVHGILKAAGKDK